jgi:hypothetical protein
MYTKETLFSPLSFPKWVLKYDTKMISDCNKDYFNITFEKKISFIICVLKRPLSLIAGGQNERWGVCSLALSAKIAPQKLAQLQLHNNKKNHLNVEYNDCDSILNGPPKWKIVGLKRDRDTEEFQVQPFVLCVIWKKCLLSK